MGRTIPKTIADRLEFFSIHLPLWSADPGALGLTAGEVAAVQALFDEARAAAAAANAARLAAEAATLVQNDALAVLTASGSNLIQRVRAFAERDTGVLAAAGLAPPSAPVRSEQRPPSPLDFAAAPRPDGSIELTWTSDLKRTSFYRLTRSFDPATSFAGAQTIGVVRDGRFIDTHLPIGFTQVEYWLIPSRQRRGGPIIEGQARRAGYRAGTVQGGSRAGLSVAA